MKRILTVVFVILMFFVAGLFLGSLFVRHKVQATMVPQSTQPARQIKDDTLGPPSPTPLTIPLGPLIVKTPQVYQVAQSQITSWILMYHYIGSPPDKLVDPVGYNLTITPESLDTQITAFEKLGYTPLTMAQAVSGHSTAKSIVLTFDDGYEDFYTDAWPVLKQHNWPATAYIITGKVGQPNYMTWSQIREISQKGIEIGAHTVNHIDLATASSAKQQYEIFTSKATLDQMLDKPVTAFAYPAGRYTAETVSYVEQAGFTTSVTTNSGYASPYYSLYELPRLRVSPQLTITELERILKGGG